MLHRDPSRAGLKKPLDLHRSLSVVTLCIGV